MRATLWTSLFFSTSLAALTACGGYITPNAGALAPSQVLPGDKATGLLYVSNQYGPSEVNVLTYPQGKLLQTLTGFTEPNGECLDKNGDVFIADEGAQQIVEYAPGGSKPKATLYDDGYEPIACAINPKNGDLAVTNVEDNTGDLATISIFKNARGKPALLSDNMIFDFAYCAYDDHGNLYADGTNGYFSGYDTYVVELPAGKTSFINGLADKWLPELGGVQWDGKYIAIGNTQQTIYRFSFAGGKLTEEGKTSLTGAAGIDQFFIDGADVIGGNTDSGSVGVWKYPAGSQLKTIKGFNTPVATVVSR